MTEDELILQIKAICWTCLGDRETQALARIFPQECDAAYMENQIWRWRGAVEYLWLSYQISLNMHDRLIRILTDMTGTTEEAHA